LGSSRVCLSVRPSICPSAWNNSAATGRIFKKFDVLVFLENISKKIQASLKSGKNNGTLHEDQYRFLIISHSVLFRMRNVSEKNCRENRNNSFMFSNFFPENRAVCEIEKYCRARQATDDNMVHAHCMLDT
jgi:hypothetical protein